MVSRTTKLRLRRIFRRKKNQVEDLGFQAEERIEQHFFKRLGRLAAVRRFVVGWIALMVLLIGGVFYQTRTLGQYFLDLQPVAGGTYTEGVLGSFTNANPLYATGPVDSAVSRLVFSSLLKYDEDNKLVGDLAETWTVDQVGETYTVTLRDGLVWQDGAPLTAQDVVFTYKTIQNPDAKSPLFASWQGIDVKAKDDKTIVFSLPNVLSSFPHSLVNGIVPGHILKEVPPAQMRALRFNTDSPIGSGPFRWSTIEVTGGSSADRETRIGLTANELYHLEKPDLQSFVIRSFSVESQMLESFEHRELTAMSGVATLPDTFSGDVTVKQLSMPLTAQVMVFFKNSNELLADSKVRQALVRSVDQVSMLEGIGFPVIASRQPFLQTHTGYNQELDQLSYDAAVAGKILDDAGWAVGKDGIRIKDGKPLTFTLYSQSTSEYAYVTQQLQSYWQKIGVKAEVLLQSDSDLQTTVAFHNYDALLYGISLGPDPDVYAYWGSTQADQRAANRVNFSEYKSTTADAALEGGRTRSDDQLRALKYKPFLGAWRNDAPAMALYQPRYLYVTRDTVFELDQMVLNTATDRYNNVHNWKIRQDYVRRVAE